MIYFDNKEFQEDQYKLYILLKYLTKHYGSEKALALIKSGNTLDAIAKALGAKDIAFFCLYFLRDIFVVQDGNEARELSPSHYEMWNLLNDTFVLDNQDKINIVVSRGFAKTTVCDLALCIWLICYKKSKFTLLGAKRDDDAVQFVDSIKKAFKENKIIINNFGDLIDRKKYKVNANEIEFANGMYIRAVGSGTSVRGANFKGTRPTVFIGDDFQDEKNILTDEARDKHYNKWSKEIEQVGDKAVFRNGIKIKSATKYVAIGTVLHLDCLMSRLMRNKDYKTFLRRAIILEPEQTVDDIFDSDLWRQCKKLYYNDKDENSKETAKQFYIDNKATMKFPVLWEEKWDCFNDLAIPYWENRQAFMSELMNDATSIGERWFKTALTRGKEEIEDNTFAKTMLCIDPASTVTKRADYTAMVVGSEATNGFLYVRDIVLEKLEFNAYCNKVVEVLLNNEDITHIFIEKNTYQGSDLIKIKELIAENDELRKRNLTFINEMQRKNKDSKISTIIDPINNGQIIFIDNNKEAIEQLLEFQGQKYSLHDDFVDVVAELFNRIKTIVVRKKRRIEPKPLSALYS